MSITITLGPWCLAFSLGLSEAEAEAEEIYDHAAYSTAERAPMGFAGYLERPDFGPEGY